jgi:hypothetical protein
VPELMQDALPGQVTHKRWGIQGGIGQLPPAAAAVTTAAGSCLTAAAAAGYTAAGYAASGDYFKFTATATAAVGVCLTAASPAPATCATTAAGRQHFKPCIIRRFVEEGHAESPAVVLPVWGWISHPVQCAGPGVVGPTSHQAAQVDQ